MSAYLRDGMLVYLDHLIDWDHYFTHRKGASTARCSHPEHSGRSRRAPLASRSFVTVGNTEKLWYVQELPAARATPAAEVGEGHQ